MIRQLIRRKALQIGGLVCLVGAFSTIDVLSYFPALKDATTLEIIILGFLTVLLNTMFVFFGFSIISDINQTNREIKKLEVKLESREKEQDS